MQENMGIFVPKYPSLIKRRRDIIRQKRPFANRLLTNIIRFRAVLQKAGHLSIHCFGVFGLYGNEYDVNKNETVLIGFGACPL